MKIEQSAGTSVGALAGIINGLKLGAITISGIHDTLVYSAIGAVAGFIVSTFCKYLWTKIKSK